MANEKSISQEFDELNISPLAIKAAQRIIGIDRALRPTTDTRALAVYITETGVTDVEDVLGYHNLLFGNVDELRIATESAIARIYEKSSDVPIITSVLSDDELTTIRAHATEVIASQLALDFGNEPRR